MSTPLDVGAIRERSQEDVARLKDVALNYKDWAADSVEEIVQDRAALLTVVEQMAEALDGLRLTNCKCQDCVNARSALSLVTGLEKQT